MSKSKEKTLTKEWNKTGGWKKTWIGGSEKSKWSWQRKAKNGTKGIEGGIEAKQCDIKQPKGAQLVNVLSQGQKTKKWKQGQIM